MTIFTVVLRKPNAEVCRRISDAFPDHFRLSDTFRVVASTVISEQVAVKAGIKRPGLRERIKQMV